MSRTPHQQRVLHVMQERYQETPKAPGIPSQETRVARVKMLMEEVFEFARAAGVEITVSHDGIDVDYAAVATPEGMQICAPLAMKKIGFTADPDCDVAGLAGMVKACACISVINIGSLVACGIEDAEVLECVDAANLLKVRSGHLDPETGKFEESADQSSPKFDHVIEDQRQRLDPNRRYGVTQTEFDFCT